MGATKALDKGFGMANPWLDWQVNGDRISRITHNLRACPFCESLHLTVQLGFEGKAGRVECRYCSSHGPWGWGHTKQSVIEEAAKKWNAIHEQSLSK
jgi:hypothetical protein